MLLACWSSKGGAGTTVVAAALACLAAEREGSPGALLADLAGDAPAVLGLDEPGGPGLAGWLAAADAPADALGRLEVPVAAGLGLLPRGEGPLGERPAGERSAGEQSAGEGSAGEARAALLAALLAGEGRAVVADCGTLPRGAAGVVAAAAERSVLVIRPCFLALRRAVASALRPTEAILVAEPGRALTRRDLEAALGVPVVAVVEVDPAVARAVDAGLLASRLPRALGRELRGAA
jgi:MinD-like ATPase involved in chromosome partitioning or flagellar assembly